MGRIMAVKVRLSEVPARQARRAARVARMAQRRRLWGEILPLYRKFVDAQGHYWLGLIVLIFLLKGV